MYVLWFEFMAPWFKFYFQFISNSLSCITIPPKERKVKFKPRVKNMCCLNNLLVSGLELFICTFFD